MPQYQVGQEMQEPPGRERERERKCWTGAEETGVIEKKFGAQAVLSGKLPVMWNGAGNDQVQGESEAEDAIKLG